MRKYLIALPTIVLLAAGCNMTPVANTTTVVPSQTSQNNAATIPGFKTYTYKNMSLQYPPGWEVVFNSQIANQPNGFYITVRRIGATGFQPDELGISTYNNDAGTKTDYRSGEDRKFVKSASGEDSIQFTSNIEKLYSYCFYSAQGQATLDICNQIISTVKIK